MPRSYNGGDTIIDYRGKRYAVNLIEDYDDKEALTKVSIFKGLGYLEFDEKNIIHNQKFQEPYQLRDTLEYRRLKNNKVRLNGIVYTIKGKDKDRLYLVRPFQKGDLYVLEFK